MRKTKHAITCFRVTVAPQMPRRKDTRPSCKGLKRELEIDLAEIAFELSEVERTKERNKAYRAISEKIRCVRTLAVLRQEILENLEIDGGFDPYSILNVAQIIGISLLIGGCVTWVSTFILCTVLIQN